jgi:hypothetical protein
MAAPGPPVSPFAWSSPDYLGNRLSVTITFNNSTFALGTVTTVRDAGCLYHNIYFGFGPGGIPDTSSKTFGGVPAGTTTVGSVTLASLGFSVIQDVLGGQITAGP